MYSRDLKPPGNFLMRISDGCRSCWSINSNSGILNVKGLLSGRARKMLKCQTGRAGSSIKLGEQLQKDSDKLDKAKQKGDH